MIGWEYGGPAHWDLREIDKQLVPHLGDRVGNWDLKNRYRYEKVMIRKRCNQKEIPTPKSEVGKNN